jgi:hypothetical protein
VAYMSEKPVKVLDLKFDPTTDELGKRTLDADFNLTNQYEKFQKIMLEHMEWKFGKDGGDYSKHPRA